MFKITQTDESLTFSVYVQPRASACTIVGEHQDALKIKLTAPPVSGAANKQCIAVLAKALSIPKSQIQITAGHSHRQKQITILAIKYPAEAIKNRLQKLITSKNTDNS
jgi:uncharacterized protein (TIGR00251 family)